MENQYFGTDDIEFQNVNDGQPIPANSQSARMARRRQAIRKPSLERQGGFEHFEEGFGADHHKQANNYDSFDYDKSNNRFESNAQLHEQYYSVDDSFRQDSYESYTNSIGPDMPLDNDMSSAVNFSQIESSALEPQRTMTAGQSDWITDTNNESIDNQLPNDTLWTRKNSEKRKEQWKSSAQTESSIWQTVSEEFDETDQVTPLFKDDKQSPQFFTPKSSIDQSADPINDRKDSFGRQSTEETVPADELHGRVCEIMPSIVSSTVQSNISSITPLIPPLSTAVGQPPSAIKSDNKPSGEPKTVTFSDDIRDRSPSKPQPPAPSMMTSSLTSSLSAANNPEGLSRARVRWIAAFNKITSEFTEVWLMVYFEHNCLQISLIARSLIQYTKQV